LSAKVKQGEATASRLLAIARKSLEQRGYAATTTQDIIGEAGVTKGALYHHFPSKPDLFEAVYRQAEAEMGGRIQKASQAQAEPFEQLVAGCFAYLECCCEGDLHRVLRLEGPAALGPARWQAIDREFGVYRLLPFLQDLASRGVIAPPSVEAFAFQITGAMNEATFWVTQHATPAKALKESKRMLRHLLESVAA
jgi:AcrR family transcriptional regulator